MTRNRPRTISLAADDRARVPFAIIGVLLLVSSVVLVAVLETRSDPEIEPSTDVAIERGEAYVTSVIRQATVRATDEVVRSPVTTVDPELRSVLGDDDEAFENQARLTIFAAVTAALEDRDQDIGQGRTVRIDAPDVDDWTDPDDLEAALDHVALEEDDGVMEITIDDLEFTVRDADGEVETTVTRDVTVSVGTTMMELHERVEQYEAHLNRGMLESVQDREGYGYDLAKRLWPLTWGKAYYDRLLGDPADRAFENVTPNDHTEVLANDARLTAQQEVFGTQDAYGNRVMAVPTLCLAFDLSQAVLDLNYDFDALAADLHPDDDVDSIDALCRDGVVSPDGELPEMPTIEELVLGMLDGIEMNGTIQGHPFADMAMYEMEAGLGQHELEDEMREMLNESTRFSEEYLEDYYDDDGNSRTDDDTISDENGLISGLSEGLNDLRLVAIEELDNAGTIIDNVYTIDVSFGSVTDVPSRDGSAHPPIPDLDSDEYDIDNLTEMEPRHSTLVERVDAYIDETTTDGSDSSLKRSLVSVDIEVEMEYRTKGRWNNTNTNSSPDVTKWDARTTNYTSTFELDGELAPDLEIDPSTVEHALDSGGLPDPYTFGSPTNWDGAANGVIEAFFGQHIESDSDLEDWIRSRVGDIETVNEFEDAIGYDTRFQEEVQLSPRSTSDLHTAIVYDDLMEVHLETVQEIEPVEADIMGMLTNDESPMREISEHVDAVEAEHVNRTGSFENAPDIARMEARQVYFDTIHKYVDELASEHERITTGGENLVTDLVGGMLDLANEIIGGPMDLLEGMLSSGEEVLRDEGGADLETPAVLNEVHIDVDGSPTYHSSQVAVNQTEVPAVRGPGDGPLEIDEEMNFAAMGVGYDNVVGLPGFPLIPWPPLFYLQVDAWEIELEGEYARFEVQATSGDPSTTSATTYVREDKDVTLETPDGGVLELGSSDPIRYENSQTIMVVVPAPQFLPQGAPGVGDNQINGASGGQCSPLWNETGPDFDGETHDLDEDCL